jgi:flagellar biosynthesis protein FlhF
LLPEFAQSLWEQLEEPGAPESRDELVAQLERARILLGHCWTEPEWKKAPLEGQSHVFVGAPGAGKTTCLSKWLAQAVLLGGRAARVYRLDGRTANTAEALSVHADILGAPVSRCWPTGPEGDGEAGELRLIDLPGFDPRDAGVMREMRERLRVWGNPVVHVVLNAAYETKLLLEQARAFGDWPGADLIFTHLDEQPEWGKLWNFVLGTKCPLGFLCAGQEVPGTFLEADPGRLWPENLEAALKQWDGKGSAETEKFV